MQRIRAEIRAQGWRALEPTGSSPGSTEVLRNNAAMALVRTFESNVEIVLLGSTDRTPHSVTVSVSEDGSTDVLALRVVEVLRARMLLSAQEERPSRADQSPRAQEASSRSLWMGMGMGMGWSPGGIPASPLGQGRASLQWSRRSSFGLVVTAPISPTRVRSAEGVARIWTGSAGLLYDFAPLAKPKWGARLGVGGGLLGLWMSGEAQAPFLGQRDRTVSALFLSRLSAHVRLGERSRVRWETLAGWATPRPVVIFDGSNVAHFGTPALYFTLALEGMIL